MAADMRLSCLLAGGTYKPGDPAPNGYLAWHEWAGVQYRAGLRQSRCGLCGRWCFPQELSGRICHRCAPSGCASCHQQSGASHDRD
jgi:hypothetical protein